MSVDMCADMRAGTCSGMRADMCVGICVDVHGHVYRHAHRRAYRHGVTAAAGVQYRDIYSHTMSFRRAGSFFLQPFTKDGVSDCLKPSDNATQIHRWSPLLTKHAEALNAPGRPVRRR